MALGLHVTWIFLTLLGDTYVREVVLIMQSVWIFLFARLWWRYPWTKSALQALEEGSFRKRI